MGDLMLLWAGILAWLRSLSATVHFIQYCILYVDPPCCGGLIRAEYFFFLANQWFMVLL